MGSVSDRGPIAAVVLALAGAVAGVAALQPRTIGVAFSDGADWTGWRPEHRAVLRAALVPLAATGDRWTEVPEGLADVVVRTYDAQGQCGHAGVWAIGSRDVAIDYACLHGDERLRYAVTHELLHFRRGDAMHLCRHASDGHDCHPSITGVGVLSPTMPWERDGDTYPPPPSSELTPADVAMVREGGR